MAVTERLGWCWAPWVQPVVERELRRRDVRPRVRERLEMVKAAVLAAYTNGGSGSVLLVSPA